jgi:diguanylate cyclase (GGDEF)-like protein
MNDPGLPPPSAALEALLAEADPVRTVLPLPAADAARRAAALAAQLGRPLDQARASAWLCAHLLRLGQHAEVLRVAPRVLPLLAAAGSAAEHQELLRVLTLSACETADFDIALDAAHELVRVTGTEGAPGPALNAAFALAACFERMGDSWQAVRLLSQALEEHGGGAPELPLLIATNGLCAISIGILHRLLDVGGEAEVQTVLQRARRAGERARELLGAVPNSVYEVAVLGNLGEVVLLQGEVQAAEPLLRHAQAMAALRGLEAHGWRVQTTLGAWMLASGRPQAALAAMRQQITDMGPTAPAQTLIRAHQVAYRACRAMNRFEDALAHLEIVERSERSRTNAQLRAQSQLFVTRTEAQHAQWQAEQARRDAQAHRERAAEAAAHAERDPLTGLGNRRHLQRRCAELLPAAQRDGRPLALAQIDIDHFKAINDGHGHAAGDRVLVAVAQLLRDNTRARDVLARHGGEEFVVVLPGMTLAQGAEVCERLRERVAAHAWPDLPGGQVVTISIGLAAAPPHDLATLLQRADEALYRAKRGGRNRLVTTVA